MITETLDALRDDCPMTTPINFAVIGCGMLARSQHIPNIAKSEKAMLHTCCDLSEEALLECREKHGALHTTTDYREAIANPDVEAVCIATTEKLRLPLIEAAAKYRKPVYCEKPVASSLAEMYKIQRIVHEAAIPFCAGHNRRSSPAMNDAHKIFRSHMETPKPCPWRFNREGDKRPPLEGDGVAGMSVRINDDWYSWKSWVFDKTQAPHGPMLFEMTHFTDLCNWFLAAEFEEVVALEHGMLNHGIVIRYRTGEIATLLMCAKTRLMSSRQGRFAPSSVALETTDPKPSSWQRGILGSQRRDLPLTSHSVPLTACSQVEGMNLTRLDMLNAYRHLMASAERARAAEWAEQKVQKVMGRGLPPNDRFMHEALVEAGRSSGRKF